MRDESSIFDVDASQFNTLLASLPQGSGAVKAEWIEDEFRPVDPEYLRRLRQVTRAYDRGRVTRAEYLWLGMFESAVGWYVQGP